MSKKYVAILMIAVFTLSTLSGCIGDDENEDEGEEEEEEEPQAKEEVKEEDIAMGPPKKLKRLSILKRVASDVEKRQKLLRDPSPRHTRSGKKLGFK